MGALTKIFGTHSERELKRIYPLVDKVESYRDSMQKLSDEELRNKTKEYKERLAKGETLDDLLPEAFATVREAAKRVLGMEHYRVQLIGGIVLHQGRIAEMKTGEGKTLVSTSPAYLNALEGKGVHIVTVNDYLAKRDAEWMGKVHEFLGLTVGVVLNDMDHDERKKAYECDITYVTNNELGFDYLRDNMVIYKEQLVQRDLHYAIIDEVDSVLIDEARTPLIISGQSGKSTRLYEACDILAKQMKRGEASQEFSKMDAIRLVKRRSCGLACSPPKNNVSSKLRGSTARPPPLTAYGISFSAQSAHSHLSICLLFTMHTTCTTASFLPHFWHNISVTSPASSYLWHSVIQLFFSFHPHL